MSMSAAASTSASTASAPASGAASASTGPSALPASAIIFPIVDWQLGPFANGTGPGSLPVLDGSALAASVQNGFPPLKNDLILRTARREEGCERAPVWVHRQAGRYLPEFRETRKLGDFFTMCRTPKIAVELTLQPIRRFALDAAIIFSDILVIPQALGLEVLMKEAVGPVLPHPIKTPQEMSRLKRREEVDVPRSLGYVFEALTLCRHSLQGTVPLIGFSGAPWTLMCYMVEGGGSKSYTQARRWLFAHPAESHQMLSLITDVIIEYLTLQVEAGAQMLEVFDTWSGELTAECFHTFIMPYVTAIASKVKANLRAKGITPVPMTLFPKGADYCLKWVAAQTEFDVISLDWSTSGSDARQALAQNRSITLQGNLDPAILYCSEDVIRSATRQMMDAFGTQGNYIGNLGHGMLPDHPLEGLRVFVDEVHKYSEQTMKKK